jgi:hypothetical protein
MVGGFVLDENSCAVTGFRHLSRERRHVFQVHERCVSDSEIALNPDDFIDRDADVTHHGFIVKGNTFALIIIVIDAERLAHNIILPIHYGSICHILHFDSPPNMSSNTCL